MHCSPEGPEKYITTHRLSFGDFYGRHTALNARCCESHFLFHTLLLSSTYSSLYPRHTLKNICDIFYIKYMYSEMLLINVTELSILY